MRNLLFISLCLLFLSSCIVERPPFSKVEKVFTLKLGMTKEEVSNSLDVSPYDFKSLDDSSNKLVLIYKYRVTDLRTIPFFEKPNKGSKINGKYMDLFVTYSKEGKAINFTSQNIGINEKEKQLITLDKVITLVTVVVPALLLYLGILKATQ